MKPGLQFRLNQQLTLTPQLQQAIRLLQLSQLELEAELRQIAESNPLLEFADDNPDNLEGDERESEPPMDAIPVSSSSSSSSSDTVDDAEAPEWGDVERDGASGGRLFDAGGGRMGRGPIQSGKCDFLRRLICGDTLLLGFRRSACVECPMAAATGEEFNSRFEISRFACHERGDARVVIRMSDRRGDAESAAAEGGFDCRVTLKEKHSPPDGDSAPRTTSAEADAAS